MESSTHSVFAVFDSAAGAYLPPFFMQTTGLAVRAFTEACNDSGHQFHRHSGDYTLFRIGLFDENTGSLFSLEAYERLGSGNEFADQVSLDTTPGPREVAV